ncbi:hypothetical protein Tco_1031782, partial [Tanacetum coccineum]
ENERDMYHHDYDGDDGAISGKNGCQCEDI